MGEKQKRTARAKARAWSGPALVALALALFLLAAPAAQAGYEQAPEHFGDLGTPGGGGSPPETKMLDGTSSVAVNESGAGGVEPGTFYVTGARGRVFRFGPGSEGEEPPFREAWGWGIADKAGEYQRCGPAYAAEPRPTGTFPTCEPVRLGGVSRGEETGHLGPLLGVSVDQSTGNVYVLHDPGSERKHHLVEVFTATGVPVGEGFGDEAEAGQTIAGTPEKLHNLQYSADLAVAEDGTAYVIDRDFFGVPGGVSRVMCFQPETPGDYEHYEYCGAGEDITGKSSYTQRFSKLALLASGRIVTGSHELIREYAPGSSTPLCTYVASGELYAMTANRLTGEVFYFTYHGEAIQRLSACDEASGEFSLLGAPIAISPETNEIEGLALNAGLEWGPARAPGVLYAADPGESYIYPHPHEAIGDVFVPAQVLVPPSVEEESVHATGSGSTSLRAEIDPNGFATAYRFQYIDQATYAARKAAAEGEGKSPEEARDTAFAGAPQAPPGGGLVPEGGVGAATANVSGLAPDTAYAFRVLASSECAGIAPPAALCEASGKPAFFNTFPLTTPAPPDGRAYELVSPALKAGGQAFPINPGYSSCEYECKPKGAITSSSIFPVQSSPDGEAVTYEGYPFSTDEGASVFNSYLSTRSSSGWRTSSMSPPLQATKFSGTTAYSSSLGRALILQNKPPTLAPGAPAERDNLYLQSTDSPAALHPLIDEGTLEAHPPHRSEEEFILQTWGHSADFSRQFFAANDVLTGPTAHAPEPPDPGYTGSDLYEWHDGALRLVNVLPDGSVAPGASLPETQKGISGASFGSGTLLESGNKSAPDIVADNAISADGRRAYWSAGSGQLYLRLDGERTLEVPDHSGEFITASADGRQVLLSDGMLYSLDEAESGFEAPVDLSGGKGGFLGIAGRSQDLSRIYFVDTAALPGAGANERGEEAQPGQPNLYSRHGSASAFVATLTPEDEGEPQAEWGDWRPAAYKRSAQASPEGRYLAFLSTNQLTGQSNVGRCNPQSSTVNACSEVFLYDSATGRLVCASCNPAGEAPVGRPLLPLIGGLGITYREQPRYLMDSGRLYFDTSDRLSPLDVNGGVEDVYEYEPAGVGSCRRAAGCLSLISPGSGSVDSNFLAANEGAPGIPAGSDVFFTTRERLVQKDSDELIDVYDAREAGGFASETETQRAECQGESCQPSPAPPSFATPGTATVEGGGNVKEKAAAGRCTAPARKAQDLSRRAKKLRRGARRAVRHNARGARRMRRRAAHLAKAARRQSKSAKRCRARLRKNRRAHR